MHVTDARFEPSLCPAVLLGDLGSSWPRPSVFGERKLLALRLPGGDGWGWGRVVATCLCFNVQHAVRLFTL